MGTGLGPLLRPLLAGRHLVLLAIVLVFASSGVAGGQTTVVVQFMNGRSGKPLAKAKVYIGFDDIRSEKPLVLTTDRQGKVEFETGAAKTFQVHPVALVACDGQPKGAPYPDYSIAEILRAGLVTRNDCGRAKAEPLRGRLLYFARPASWWELFKN
ncbi:MAG: hypothetical protein ACRD2H_10555 [Terriglobales bacterium]